MRELVKQVRAIGNGCRPASQSQGAQVPSEALRRGHAAPSPDSYRWSLAPSTPFKPVKDAKTCSAFSIEDMHAVVFRIPLRDAMRIARSLEQAVDEVQHA